MESAGPTQPRLYLFRGRHHQLFSLPFQSHLLEKSGVLMFALSFVGPFCVWCRVGFLVVSDFRGAFPASNVTLVRYCFVNLLRFRFRLGVTLWVFCRFLSFPGVGLCGFRPLFLLGLSVFSMSCPTCLPACSLACIHRLPFGC